MAGRLLQVHASPSDRAALGRLGNPFALEEDPGAYQTTGWYGAYDATPSTHVIAAESAADIAAAVRFCREHDIRLAVRGTGHDYLGRSSAPGSLLVWTHGMRDIVVHDAFVPAGQPDGRAGVPAVTVGAGTRWLEVYQALAPHGRLALGGGCTSVGAAGGFTQGGGFGHFSRRFGTAAGNVLEAEVVTADGEIRTVNDWRHPDLFWALRGGGGGTFGVVSKLTMRTHPLPDRVVMVGGTIRAASDEGFRRLLGALVRFLPELCDDRWGEQIYCSGDNTVQLTMTAVDFGEDEARAAWRPLLAAADGDEELAADVSFLGLTGAGLWDPGVLDRRAAGSIRRDDRTGQPADRFWWTGDSEQVAMYLHAYQSRWLPGRLLGESPDALAAALFAATRHALVRLQLNKALWGAAADARARDLATAVHPAAFDAAALVIVASAQRCAFPGVPGHEPDQALAAAGTRAVGRAMAPIRALTPDSGTYLNEADYFEPGWQRSFWGAHYPRLLAVKRAYDPDNLFRVHHGVGSEDALVRRQ